MNCILNSNEQEELLLGYCQGNLAMDTAGAFERHLRTCPHCQELVALQNRVDEVMLDWRTPEISANFDALLLTRIRDGALAEQPWYRKLLPMNWGWKPAIPLALAGVALAFFLMRAPAVPTVQSEVFKADEIEQVERALDDIEAIQSLHQTGPDIANQEAL